MNFHWSQYLCDRKTVVIYIIYKSGKEILELENYYTIIYFQIGF